MRNTQPKTGNGYVLHNVHVTPAQWAHLQQVAARRNLSQVAQGLTPSSSGSAIVRELIDADIAASRAPG